MTELQPLNVSMRANSPTPLIRFFSDFADFFLCCEVVPLNLKFLIRLFIDRVMALLDLEFLIANFVLAMFFSGLVWADLLSAFAYVVKICM